jgi:GNAT superfamily N-acetyltransferase
MEWKNDAYTISDDRRRLDLAAICALLATTYWAGDRPRDLIEKSIRHSVCFGLFHGGRQVGFARAVTDHATFTWVCDVIIDPAHRGRGLGKWLMQCLLDHPDLQTVSHQLRTEDAHGLYQRFGFKRVDAMRRSTKP